MVIIMSKIKDKEEKIDINCMLHKCKRCPKQRECEEIQKRGDTIERKTNTKTREVHTEHSKWYEPKRSIQE